MLNKRPVSSIPPAVHEAAVEHFRHPGQADNVLDLLSATVRTAREKLEALVGTANKLRSQDLGSPVRAERLLRDEAEKLQDQIAKQVRDARETAAAELQRLETQMESPVVSDVIAREVRDRLYGMAPEKRAELLRKADDVIVASLLGAPAFLSGCTDSELLAVKALDRSRQFGNTEDRAKRLSQAIKAANRCDASVQRFLNGAEGRDGLVRHREIAAADLDEGKIRDVMKGVA